VFGKYGYNARALKRPERGAEYVSANAAWFAGMDPQSAIVLKCEFRANGASPKFYPVRLFPNNLTEHDDGLAHAVDNTLPCGL